MRALITGVAGQDGTLLSELLSVEGWEVFGTRLPGEVLPDTHVLSLDQTVELDITDFDQVCASIASGKPDVIFHLAGISSVAFSLTNPELTHVVNVGGTRNLIDSVSQLSLQNTLLVHAASTEIFAECEEPISEVSRIGPRSPYAESKAKAVAVIQEARKSGLRATNAILANHESYLRTPDFVTGKIALEIARISHGLSDHITLGNLSIEKNWSSARDIVAGLYRIAQVGYVGDVVLANHSSTKLSEILDAAFAQIGISEWQPYVRTDPAHVRNKEAKVVRIDPSLAKQELSWVASTPLQTWVAEMVSYHQRNQKVT